MEQANQTIDDANSLHFNQFTGEQTNLAAQAFTANGQPTKLYRGWNELKVSGKLPERRSYHVANVHQGEMFIFGGQDENSISSIWRLDLQQINKASQGGKNNIYVNWEQIKIRGKEPEPMTHHTSFVHNNKIYCYGGLIGK